jgi:ferric-dicitrate binding protein FerR (iron transport regulator)
MVNKRWAKERWEYLAGKYLAGTCTREELDELLLLVNKEPRSKELVKVLQQHWESAHEKAPAEGVDWDARFHTMMQQTEVMAGHEAPPVSIRRWRWYMAAASVLIFLICASWFGYFLSSKGHATGMATAKTEHSQQEIFPGGNKAVLTLANGDKVILDSAQNGSLGVQANMKIVKITSGVLAYKRAASDELRATRELLYNTIATPRGGQYQVILADGSKVWLNASSSLRFPTSFTGKQRNVELTGEAYFEVAKDVARPFKVKVLPGAGGGETREVEVLGTSFNVMAYSDEKMIQTTLVDGAVKVRNGKDENILEPGQQAQSGPGVQGQKVIADVDVAAVVAWKNGYFNFNKEDLRTVMRQLARWYDVDVSYIGNNNDRVFWGGMQRDLSLSAVFRILEKSGVQFSIDGKKVIVTM